MSGPPAFRSLTQRSSLNGEVSFSVSEHESGPLASVIFGPDGCRLTSDSPDWLREVAANALSAANGLDAARAKAEGGES